MCSPKCHMVANVLVQAVAHTATHAHNDALQRTIVPSSSMHTNVHSNLTHRVGSPCFAGSWNFAAANTRADMRAHVRHHDEVGYEVQALPSGLHSPITKHNVAANLNAAPQRTIQRVAITASNPPWHSASPQTSVQLIADLELYRMASADDILQPESLWECTVLCHATDMMIRRKGHTEWVMLACVMGGAAALSWATESRTGDEATVIQLCTGFLMQAIAWFFLANTREWDAMQFEWVGPHHLHTLGTTRQPGVYALAFEGIRSLLEVAAMHLCWQMPNTTLRQFAFARGVQVLGCGHIVQTAGSNAHRLRFQTSLQRDCHTSCCGV